MLSMFHGLLWSIQVERCGDYAFWLARQICLGEGWCLDHSMNWWGFVQTDPFDPLCLSLDCVQPQRDLGGTMANLWNQADLDKAEFEKKSAPWPPWRSLGRTREASFLTPPNPDLTMPDASSKMRLSTVSGIWADFGKFGLLGSCEDTEEKWIEMDILAEYTTGISMILAHIESVFTHYFTKRSPQIWRTDLMPGSRCWDAQADMQTPKQYNASICHESKCILALVRPQKRSGLGAEGGRSDVKYMESLGDLGLNLQALDIKETLHVAFLASFPLRELGTAMDAFWSWRWDLPL